MIYGISIILRINVITVVDTELQQQQNQPTDRIFINRTKFMQLIQIRNKKLNRISTKLPNTKLTQCFNVNLNLNHLYEFHA